MTWTVAGVAVAAAVAVASSTRLGAGTLAAVLGAAAVVRAVRPEPGPAALAVRSRPLDVMLLAVLAVALGVLAVVVPS